MIVEFIKECVWSFRKRRRLKQTLEYNVGDIVSDLPDADAKQMVDCGYAKYAKEDALATETYIEGERLYQQGVDRQVKHVETKDIRTKPVAKNVTKADKTTDDHKSDKV